MATHSSVLAWRISGTAEPGGLPSMGSHKVGHDWSDLAAAAAACVDMNLSKLQEFDGQGGLACCNSWGCKEPDMTEQLTELNWCGEMRWESWYLLVCVSKTSRIWEELDPGFEQLLLWISSTLVPCNFYDGFIPRFLILSTTDTWRSITLYYGELSFVECLAASLTSTHQIPVAPSSKLWQQKCLQTLPAVPYKANFSHFFKWWPQEPFHW